MRALLYIVVFSLPILTWIGFNKGGWTTYFTIILAFGLIPLLELLIKPSSQNLSKEQASSIAKNPLYDVLIYLVPFIVYGTLGYFLFSMKSSDHLWYERLGMILGMGIVMGAMGINVAHELGHRRSKGAQFLAKALLTASQYTQFFIDHNKGHHRNVGTPEDSATARYGESLYHYWFRVIRTSYLSAWEIANMEVKRKRKSVYSLSNEMLQMQLGQLVLLIAVLAVFGWEATLYYVIAAVVSIILLETVEYVEHYGLSRKKVTEHRYENVTPIHSWNSNHMLGRLFLFELSRHSDHHYDPQKKYPVLNHWDESPQLPTGYPGCMLMATIPALWFKKVNPLVPDDMRQ